MPSLHHHQEIETSLSLLLPGKNNEEHDPPLPSRPRLAKYRLSTSSQLEDLSRRLIAEINNRSCPQANREFSSRHIHPKFRATFGTPESYDWSRYAKHCGLYEGHSCTSYEVNIINVTADISDSNGTGVVNLLTEVMCWTTNLRKVVITVHKWRKRHNEWLCFEAISMIGIDLSSCPDCHHRHANARLEDNGDHKTRNQDR